MPKGDWPGRVKGQGMRGVYFRLPAEMYAQLQAQAGGAGKVGGYARRIVETVIRAKIPIRD